MHLSPWWLRLLSILSSVFADLLCFPLFVGILILSLVCYALLCVLSSFAIILKRKRELVALLLLLCKRLFTINVLRLFLTVPWVGMQCVIVVFPDHTHLLSDIILSKTRITQMMTSLRGCTGWSATLFFSNPNTGFITLIPIYV